ncbi:MAG: class B sortase [Clostridia bacterium]|nr:class B sortase [Clostridia bacterium]
MRLFRRNSTIAKALCLFVILTILIGCLSGCNGCTGAMDPDDYSNVVNTTPSTESTEPVSGSTAPLAENPINFDELTALNPDLYAWIRIPGTVIDYPVAQSSNEDDNYYLHHNYLGNYEFAGTIYSQRHNTKYFVEQVTVLYGHNMRNGSMFAGLHNYYDKEFFDENELIYIYIDGHILTYRIFAAYDYDDRHLLNSFDFSDKEVYSNYLKDCLNPRSANALVREGVELTTDDRIITLSTCTNYNSSLRFLVQGVLINDELTK